MGCVLLVGSATVHAEVHSPAPVTVEQAVAHAEARPALAAALAGSVAIEDAASEQAGVWPNPVIHYETERISDGDPGETEDSVLISQSLDLSGRRGLRADAASKRGRAAGLDGDATRLRTGVETRRRFWEVVRQQALHTIAQDWVQHLETAMERVQERHQAGVTPIYETLQMAQAMRSARADIGRAVVEREASWLELLALTGELDFPAQWPRVQGALAPSQSDIRALAGDQMRSDVHAWALREDAAQLEVKAAERGWMPELELSGGWRGVEENGTARRDGFQAGIGVSLPLFDHGQGEAAVARAREQRARAMRELLAEDVRRQERPALERALGLSALAGEIRTKMNAAARQIETMAEASWVGGEMDVIELLFVHRGVRDDALTVLELEHSARQAREELREIVLKEAP
jgi:cobalt-zinc-cadmium efflux system outer membrane protein